MSTNQNKIWMDSGAFSAFTKGEEQSLPDYCAFLKRNDRYLTHYAVLDDIRDPQKTWDNQMRMEQEFGTHPVPCFHYGEDPKFLVKYLENYDYLALGGMVPISTPQLVLWLDNLWENYLTDSSGLPIIKVHGFGLTTFELMARYPWFSVDSSSWLQSAHYGLIIGMDSQGKLFRINISRKSGKTGELGQHYFTETASNRAALDKLFALHGFDADGLADHYQLRDEFNAITYAAYANRWKLFPFTPSYFDMLSAVTKQAPDRAASFKVDWEHLEIYLAGEVTLEVEGRLHSRGANRMFSYHYLKDRTSKSKKGPGSGESNNFRAVKGCIDGLPFPETKNCQEKQDAGE